MKRNWSILLLLSLVAFTETPVPEESIGNEDFYGLIGISPAKGAGYDLRAIVDLIGMSLNDI